MSHPRRLVPYVDLVIDHRRRRYSSPLAPSSPHKKRRLTRTEAVPFTDDEISTNLTRVNLDLSPTASEYNPQYDADGIEAGGEEGDGDDGETSTKSYSRSPSLGAFSRTAGASSSGLKGKYVDHYSSPLLYEPTEDEIFEDSDFMIPGETPLDEDDIDISEIPVRVLSNFTILNEDTLEIVPVEELLSLQYSKTRYSISGLVKPWMDFDSGDEESDNEDSVEETEDRLRCPHILELSVHNLLDSQKYLDGKIYIRTKYAWYILDSPSPVYSSFFTPFWIRHRLLHLLINTSLENARLTRSDFVENLPKLDEADETGLSTSDIILERQLCKQDMESEDVLAYLVSSLPDICTENRIKISRVPVIRELMGSEHYEFDIDISSQRSPRKSKKTGPKSSAKLSNKEKEVLKHRNKTFLTPIVNQIAKDFFEGSLEVIADQEELNDDVYVKLPKYKAHHSDPLKIKWGPCFPGENVFKCANVDGTLYKIGDVVMVEPDIEPEDNGNLKASHTINKYGNRWWFCQIRHFFEKTVKGVKVKMFHGLWFHHGSRTLLQETSHSKALYLLESCDDIHVTAIFKKCNFKLLQPGEEEVPDDGSCDSNDFHCGYLYNEEHVAFLNIPDNALDVDLEAGYTCFSCYAKTEHNQIMETKRPSSDTFDMHGISYHVHDFVYLHPSSSSKLLDIGQIAKIHKSDQVTVNLLGRYDEYVEYQKSHDSGSDLISDERKLFFTDNSSVLAFHKLDGVCQVLHLSEKKKIEEWIKHDDHYYLDQKGSKKSLQDMAKNKFNYCKLCYKEDQEHIHQVKRFSLTNSKLVGMELFCGAGGLGIGIDLSGFVETKYAVEFSPSAAKTYQKNHPDTIVYCQDTSSLLKHVITGMNDQGQKKPLLSKLDDQSKCPELPKKSDSVDFIFGGPPCQSFSRANHSKRRDDIRSSLACNMLSYVEFYEPSYFLLENVGGFLDHKFYTTHVTESGEAEHQIKAGMVKLIVRTLIALGYQVHYKLLQAGQYGAPQSRRRVIFWGARRGVPLPDFPVPVYAFPTPANHVSLPTGVGKKLSPPTRSKNPENFHFWAPLRPRTVNDAIGDLPPFDWDNPHQLIAASSRDRKEARKRLEEDGIPRFNATQQSTMSFDDLPGFPNGALYPVAPQNRYQLWLRKAMDEDDLVTGQYTTRLASRIVEATCNVPMKPLADHRDLPAILLPNHAKPGRPKANKRTFYGRMDGDGHFKCAVTTLSPCLKNQWPVHPSQKRIISVREAARSQGFPDDYIFESSNTKPSLIVEDQLRQIGNAVAVPFALALGKELGKAMIKAWEQRGREGSEDF